MVVPKLNRCSYINCNVYILILQHQASKDVWVVRCRDYNVNPLRMHLNISLLDNCLHPGTYDYFVVSDEDWVKDGINIDQVRESDYQTEKEAITINDMYIVVGGKLLVTKFFQAEVRLGDEIPVDGEGNRFSVKDQVRDGIAEDDIVKTLTILGRGMLKYKESTMFIEPKKEYVNQKTFKEYEG